MSAVKIELPLAISLNAPVPPLIILQVPVPISGVLPPNALLTSKPQKSCEAPVVAIVGTL